ncbi:MULTISPECIES: GntR family transcriptional regulator [Streptomyces]|uniref:GntR family transcriptional regulator n=1 Tax=Streptomyces thermoviolaceus subsp. thermoviolaceus TaxID=66860 RepID=A0ABX0YXT7_STRTL|nr:MULTISPECIES: GntR family transcriptional regulator [Streptomyces]WTD47607.1 GntR family transcriptional regulator [Streptomyces thermoviolaceus]NJP15893.1 GntR family transcriptional regulator [Streptomyces thermoviolaceus subsp. thermoviolaceus]RSS07827.1 GntR family transcriptional regulator [Streptomyces sp. WAC00469]GGV79677.1 GntR family transcriptional regulator [Streptomyces thermoviolaceus subsp. apingens]GHA96507.1 GntR family transcriptional regulator [Streptomyces thermoviolaceu
MAFGEQPAYLRVAGDLRKKIVEGLLPPHTRLPSQARIREEYGVSDTVALEARKVLMAEGLVEGRSGSGTYVRERPTPRRIARSGFRPATGASPFRQEQASPEMRGTWEASSAQTEATPAVAERLRIQPGDRVMCTKYVFRTAGEAMMLSTSWEPLALTGRTPVMLPEEGPLGGMGVVERMRAIDVIVDNVTEEVGARPGLAEELHTLGGVPGHVVLVVQRTFYASGRPVETADVVIPADRYRVAYHLPVR